MKNQDLKLQFIETGRLSNGEMGIIYGGVNDCTGRTVCSKEGKNSCTIWYYQCTDLNDPNQRYTCNGKTWVYVDL
jgi:hypothetical protein